MRTSTRVVAWVNIALYVAGVLALLLCAVMLSLGRGAGILDYAKSHGHDLRPILKPGRAVIGAAALAFMTFWIWLYPWLCLLKRKSWAWWVLIALTSLNAMASLHPLLDSAFTLKHALTTAFTLDILPVITFVALLADRPSGWRGSGSRGKSSKRKRRAKR